LPRVAAGPHDAYRILTRQRLFPSAFFARHETGAFEP
jgi:hypothetical protein